MPRIMLHTSYQDVQSKKAVSKPEDICTNDLYCKKTDDASTACHEKGQRVLLGVDLKSTVNYSNMRFTADDVDFESERFLRLHNICVANDCVWSTNQLKMLLFY